MDEAFDENEPTPKNKEINAHISYLGIYSKETILNEFKDLTIRIIMPILFAIGNKLERMYIQW